MAKKRQEICTSDGIVKIVRKKRCQLGIEYVLLKGLRTHYQNLVPAVSSDVLLLLSLNENKTNLFQKPNKFQTNHEIINHVLCKTINHIYPCML